MKENNVSSSNSNFEKIEVELSRRHKERKRHAENKGKETGRLNQPLMNEEYPHPVEIELHAQYQSDIEYLRGNTQKTLEKSYEHVYELEKEIQKYSEEGEKIRDEKLRILDENCKKKLEELEGNYEASLRHLEDNFDRNVQAPFITAEERLRRVQEKLDRDFLNNSFKSNLWYIIFLMIIGICELPLNMKVFENFREGVTQTMIMAFSLVFVIPLAAHYTGLYLKRRTDNAINIFISCFIFTLVTGFSVYVGILRSEYISTLVEKLTLTTEEASPFNLPTFILLSMILYSIGILLSYSHYDESSELQAAFANFEKQKEIYEIRSEEYQKKKEAGVKQYQKEKKEIENQSHIQKEEIDSKLENMQKELSEYRSQYDEILASLKAVEQNIKNNYISGINTFREYNLRTRENHAMPKTFQRDPRPLELTFEKYEELVPNPIKAT